MLPPGAEARSALLKGAASKLKGGHKQALQLVAVREAHEMVAAAELEHDVSGRTTLSLSDITLRTEEFRFEVDKHSFPKFKDDGKACASLLGFGARVDFDVEMTADGALQVKNT